MTNSLTERTCGLVYWLIVFALQNDFWDVMEASVTVFLVTEIDDLVLYCVKRHPGAKRTKSKPPFVFLFPSEVCSGQTQKED